MSESTNTQLAIEPRDEDNETMNSMANIIDNDEYIQPTICAMSRSSIDGSDIELHTPQSNNSNNTSKNWVDSVLITDFSNAFRLQSMDGDSDDSSSNLLLSNSTSESSTVETNSLTLPSVRQSLQVTTIMNNDVCTIPSTVVLPSSSSFMQSMDPCTSNLLYHERGNYYRVDHFYNPIRNLNINHPTAPVLNSSSTMSNSNFNDDESTTSND